MLSVPILHFIQPQGWMPRLATFRYRYSYSVAANLNSAFIFHMEMGEIWETRHYESTGELGYDGLNGTRKIGPSYAKSVVYIWRILDMHRTGTRHIVRHMQKSVIQWSVISKFTCNSTLASSIPGNSVRHTYQLGNGNIQGVETMNGLSNRVKNWHQLAHIIPGGCILWSED